MFKFKLMRISEKGFLYSWRTFFRLYTCDWLHNPFCPVLNLLCFFRKRKSFWGQNITFVLSQIDYYHCHLNFTFKPHLIKSKIYILLPNFWQHLGTCLTTTFLQFIPRRFGSQGMSLLSHYCKYYRKYGLSFHKII